MTMQSAPTGMQPVGNVTEEAISASGTMVAAAEVSSDTATRNDASSVREAARWLGDLAAAHAITEACGPTGQTDSDLAATSLAPMVLGTTGETAAEEDEIVGIPDPDDRPPTPEEQEAVGRELTALFEQWDREAEANSQPPDGTAVVAGPTGDVIGETAAANEMADGAEAVALPGDLAAADEPTELAEPESQPEWGVAPDDFHAGSPDDTSDDEDSQRPDILGDEADEARENEAPEVDDNGVTDLGTEATTPPDVNETPPGATTEAVRDAAPAASSTEASQAGSAAADEAASEAELNVQYLSKQALDSLLDELTGDLVALEDFDREVNDRAFESEWLGSHTDLSLAVFQAKLLKTGKYTPDVDDGGKLLSDPVKYRLARKDDARITLRVYGGLSEAQKRSFILLKQARERVRTEAENRELKRRIILAGLVQGLTYKSIAEMAGVHPMTVRNVENRAVADSNSKLGNTKRPDGRFNPETREKIVEASKLRAEGKSNPEIAAAFNTDEKTVAKWFKDPPAQSTTKIEDKPDKKAKTRRSASSPQPPQPIKDIAADDGVPPLHGRALKRLGQGTQAYIDRLQVHAAEIRQEVEAVSDIDEMQDFLLCYSLGLALGELRLRNLLRGGGEIDVEEAVPPGDSSPNKAEHEPDTILLGTVMAIEPHEVLVALPVGGGGVIDNRDNYLDWHAPPKVDKVVRVRVEGFDWRRGLWKLQQVGRQTPAPAPGAIAGSYRDDRCSPDADLAGRKAGPKEMGVTK
jgi:transposase